MEIDWDVLEDIRERQQNDSAFSNLSEVYVPGEGDYPQAFIIGEAPGAQEEVQGRPFVGPAGRALRDLMALANLYASPHKRFDWDTISEINCWLTNVVKYRPPRNRTPTATEVKVARYYLRMEWIAVGRPQLIIPVGATALAAVTGRRASILAVSGKPYFHQRKGQPLITMWPMIHPAFGLRTESARPLIEQDWEKLGEWRASHQG